ncbi:UvrD-helicase domain-containing protein, partial [bacterium]|nr:UvrD-helicase domain-containing protein [bacterium]
MAENLTKSQIAATTIPVGTIIVAAGAGTGKTTVLSHTVTQKMIAAEHVKIDDLLILTFTKKAAVEMAERIAERLKEMARESDDQLEKKRLLDAASQVPDAAIETLDAFAVKMLRDNPSETGLDPDFEVLSEERNLEIGHEAGRRLLEDWLANPPHELWPEVVKGIELENWPWIFHRLNQHLMTRRAMNLTALLMGRDTGSDENLDKIIRELKEERDRKLQECLNEIRGEIEPIDELIKETIRIGEEGGQKFTEKAKQVQQDLPELQSWLKSSNLDWNASIIQEVSKWRLFGTTKDEPGEANRLVKLLRNHLTSEAKSVKDIEKSERLRALGLEAQMFKYRLPLARALMKFHNAALLARRSHNALSFADCEIEALSLLEDFPEIRDKYNKQYRYVIVDEYQDINPLQQELIFKLARQSDDKPEFPSNLYVVGDERQSIYGFRDADFRLLRDLRLNMQDVRDENAGDRILHENFRSRPEILNFTNHLFRTIWGSQSDTNEIEHTDLKPSFEYYFRDGEPGKSRIELHIIKAGDSITGKLREAAQVAKRINEIVSNNEVQVTEKTGSVRPIEWGDCAVLMRKRAGLSLMEHALSSLGVPFVTESGGGFWDTSEASDLISLLFCFSKSVDNLDWAVLLRSPIIGISDDGLMEISLASDRGNWRDVFKTVSLADDSDRRKLATFIDWFESVEKSAGRVPAFELVDKAMQSSGYLE